MKYVAIALTITAGLVGGAFPARAQSTGAYYATPSWDQTLPDATRFVLLSNFASQAVLDRNTGLTWQRQGIVASSFNAAIAICRESNAGGHYGWRVPAITELQTLMDNSNGVSSVPPAPFEVDGSYNYITTTLDETDVSRFGMLRANASPQNVWSAYRGTNFGRGVAVLCVRGGAGFGPLPGF